MPIYTNLGQVYEDEGKWEYDIPMEQPETVANKGQNPVISKKNKAKNLSQGTDSASGDPIMAMLDAMNRANKALQEMPEEDQRQAGLDILKHQMWQRLLDKVDPVDYREIFNDTMTTQERVRRYDKGNPDIIALDEIRKEFEKNINDPKRSGPWSPEIPIESQNISQLRPDIQRQLKIGGEGLGGGRPVEDTIIELESKLHEYATGKISSSIVQKFFKDRGWSVNLRSKKGEASAFDPSGKQHWLGF